MAEKIEAEPEIIWESPLKPCGGDGEDTVDRLCGTVTIGGIHFHVEAWEVEDAHGHQRAKDGSDGLLTDFGRVLEIVGDDAQTVPINGRQYVVAITPFQR